MLNGDIQIFDDLGLFGDDIDELLIDLIRIEIVEPDPVEVHPAQRSQQIGQTALPIEVGTIAGDILGDDHKLPDAALSQPPASSSRDSIGRLRYRPRR